MPLVGKPVDGFDLREDPVGRVEVHPGVIIRELTSLRPWVALASSTCIASSRRRRSSSCSSCALGMALRTRASVSITRA